LLAEVDNARFAIALRDPVAATNDVMQALSFAEQLSTRPSKLIRTGPTSIGDRQSAAAGGTGSYPAPLTDFGVVVTLNSVQAELAGNLQAADADLHSIQSRIPQALIPANLALLRAAASLELARTDASVGENSDLKTQLLCAQSALSSYRGPAHVAEASALAATIGQSLAQQQTLDTMLPYRLNPWLSKVVGWAHSESWIAPIP
jgi:hypothetical protein